MAGADRQKQFLMRKTNELTLGRKKSNCPSITLFGSMEISNHRVPPPFPTGHTECSIIRCGCERVKMTINVVVSGSAGRKSTIKLAGDNLYIVTGQCSECSTLFITLGIYEELFFCYDVAFSQVNIGAFPRQMFIKARLAICKQEPFNSKI